MDIEPPEKNGPFPFNFCKFLVFFRFVIPNQNITNHSIIALISKVEHF